jgi:hypothetical protein
VKISPSTIRDWATALDGCVDPTVAEFADRIATQMEQTEGELDRLRALAGEATSMEEAVRRTLIDATATRDAILAEADRKAAGAIAEAERFAERTRRAAADDARATELGARAEALEVLEHGRRVAEGMLAAARVEQAELEGRIVQLRAAVAQTETVLKSLAAVALPEVTEATLVLDGVGAGDIEVVMGDGTPPERVERMLGEVRGLS